MTLGHFPNLLRYRDSPLCRTFHRMHSNSQRFLYVTPLLPQISPGWTRSSGQSQPSAPSRKANMASRTETKVRHFILALLRFPPKLGMLGSRGLRFVAANA